MYKVFGCACIDFTVPGGRHVFSKSQAGFQKAQHAPHAE